MLSLLRPWPIGHGLPLAGDVEGSLSFDDGGQHFDVPDAFGRDCGETRDCNFSRFTFRGYSCRKGVAAKLTKNSCTKGRKAISELHA